MVMKIVKLAKEDEVHVSERMEYFSQLNNGFFFTKLFEYYFKQEINQKVFQCTSLKLDEE